MTTEQKIKFNKINGWSYKTSDNKFIIANCGERYWFSAEVDAEQSEKFGWLIANEFTKVYHTTLRQAQNWVRSYNYKEAK